MKPHLLLVDDDEDIRMQMRWALESEYEIHLAEDRRTAMQTFTEHRPPVTLLDLGLPPNPGDPTEGFAVLTDILNADPLAKVIIVTGQSDKQNAVQAVGLGAYDFLCKPLELDELRVILRRCHQVAKLEHQYRQMQEQFSLDEFQEMLGSSANMQQVFTLLRKVAPSDASVLILGESGTGKEMAGRAIHRLSLRKDGPFVAINCGAIPENLLESELFGHEKGAFTGAHAARPGRLELANDGTLFLDEIGELSTALQVKLLRFLQERSIERVGGRKLIPVDTRVIAATNADLKTAVAEGSFREDLFYRLAVVTIRIPPLRERDDDVVLLAKAFLKRFAAQEGRDGLVIDERAARAIREYRWPGNVRELENRVKRAVIMAEGNTIRAGDLELTSSEEIQIAAHTLKEAREALEREMVSRSLQKHGGKIAPAAADLGVSRPTLYELIGKLGIKRE
ncbi:MAG: PEP-CTERM-box response regulator transcription factor [Thermoguttaceae bacterium]|nr:PEP-CTERM-box response regulator transcription factor [Thermoguttaceae bacterium]